jgi:hypothetical protein
MGCLTGKISQEARRCGYDAKVENVASDFHRQVDTQDFVFVKGRSYRYGQLRRQLGSVSQRMLTRTLRNFESAGLVARRMTGSKTVAVEYSLTQRGRTIITPLRGMCRWAKRYR